MSKVAEAPASFPDSAKVAFGEARRALAHAGQAAVTAQTTPGVTPADRKRARDAFYEALEPFVVMQLVFKNMHVLRSMKQHIATRCEAAAEAAAAAGDDEAAFVYARDTEPEYYYFALAHNRVKDAYIKYMKARSAAFFDEYKKAVGKGVSLNKAAVRAAYCVYYGTCDARLASSADAAVLLANTFRDLSNVVTMRALNLHAARVDSSTSARVVADNRAHILARFRTPEKRAELRDYAPLYHRLVQREHYDTFFERSHAFDALVAANDAADGMPDVATTPYCAAYMHAWLRDAGTRVFGADAYESLVHGVDARATAHAARLVVALTSEVVPVFQKYAPLATKPLPTDDEGALADGSVLAHLFTTPAASAYAAVAQFARTHAATLEATIDKVTNDVPDVPPPLPTVAPSKAAQKVLAKATATASSSSKTAASSNGGGGAAKAKKKATAAVAAADKEKDAEEAAVNVDDAEKWFATLTQRAQHMHDKEHVEYACVPLHALADKSARTSSALLDAARESVGDAEYARIFDALASSCTVHSVTEQEIACNDQMASKNSTLNNATQSAATMTDDVEADDGSGGGGGTDEAVAADEDGNVATYSGANVNRSHTENLLKGRGDRSSVQFMSEDGNGVAAMFSSTAAAEAMAATSSSAAAPGAAAAVASSQLVQWLQRMKTTVAFLKTHAAEMAETVSAGDDACRALIDACREAPADASLDAVLRAAATRMAGETTSTTGCGALLSALMAASVLPMHVAVEYWVRLEASGDLVRSKTDDDYAVYRSDAMQEAWRRAAERMTTSVVAKWLLTERK